MIAMGNSDTNFTKSKKTSQTKILTAIGNFTEEGKLDFFCFICTF